LKQKHAKSKEIISYEATAINEKLLNSTNHRPIVQFLHEQFQFFIKRDSRREQNLAI
jgi:hypothetical protein